MVYEPKSARPTTPTTDDAPIRDAKNPKSAKDPAAGMTFEEGQAQRQPAAEADWRAEIAKNRDALVSAAKMTRLYTDREGNSYIEMFNDPRLERARRHYCDKVGAQPQADKNGSGDSEGADAQGLPDWFNAIQNQLIDNAEWSVDQEVMQLLLTAYLNATDGDNAANVMAFFEHVGKSELNEQAEDLSYGAGAKVSTSKSKAEAMKKTTNWCQQASNDALAQGLARCGYTFKGRKPQKMEISRFGARPKTMMPQGLMAAIAATLFPTLKPPEDGGEKATGGYWGSVKCWGAKLEAGDMCSFVSKSSSRGNAGHAVTIVGCDMSGDRRKVRYVSGNAGSKTAGSGAIRVEETTWIAPPKGGFDIYQERPKEAGAVWVFSITKSSQLQPDALDKVRTQNPGLMNRLDLVYTPENDRRS